jgi:hypothetical protein
MHISVDTRAHGVHIGLTNEDTHMAFDATPTAPNPYLPAIADRAAERKAMAANDARADRALKATGGDKLKALGLMLSGKV